MSEAINKRTEYICNEGIDRLREQGYPVIWATDELLIVCRSGTHHIPFSSNDYGADEAKVQDKLQTLYLFLRADGVAEKGHTQESLW